MSKRNTKNGSQITGIALLIIVLTCTALVLSELATNVISDMNYHKDSVLREYGLGHLDANSQLKAKQMSDDEIPPETAIGF